MFFTYILQSKLDHTFYVGSTNNKEKRLKEHNSGQSRYTKNKRPWIVAHSEEFKTLSEARRREKKIKSWKKRAAIEKLIHAPIV